MLIFCLQFDSIRREQFLQRLVLDRFNKACRAEDRILCQINEKQTYSDFYYEDFFFFITSHENAYSHKISTKTLCYEFLNCFRGLYYFKYEFSYIIFKILTLYNDDSKIFAFNISGLKCCLHI